MAGYNTSLIFSWRKGESRSSLPRHLIFRHSSCFVISEEHYMGLFSLYLFPLSPKESMLLAVRVVTCHAT
jgi:hypothetical protein